MQNVVASLGLLGLASAVPLTSRQVVPHYPPTSLSTGFRLIANVTDPSKDFNPPVNNWVFNGIHVGAGLNDAVLLADGADSGRILYQNGTAAGLRFNEGSVLSDGGTPPFPFGISVQAADATDSDGYHEVSLNAGSGTSGVLLARFPEVYPILHATAPGTFVACNQTAPYYNQNFITVRWAYDVFNSTTALYDHQIPDGCTAITLVPECATLKDLPEGSLSSHEYAANSTCYEDVSAIDWTQYGP
jgi:hypothetical protein